MRFSKKIQSQSVNRGGGITNNEFLLLLMIEDESIMIMIRIMSRS